MKTPHSMLIAVSAFFAFAFTWTPPSQAAQSTYSFTIIANFGPSGQVPSILAEGPVITNDGTVVYSAGTQTVQSSIFSSDGTVTRLLLGPIAHPQTPLITSVSGNGMMVTNVFIREIIDVHDGTVVGQFDPGDEFKVGIGPNFFYEVSINNRGSVAFTGGVLDMCSLLGENFLAFDQGVFRFDGETTTTIATLGTPHDLGFLLAAPSINERGQVAFLVRNVSDLCPITPGIAAGALFVGDGTRLVKIAEANSAPSLNNSGEVGFIGVTGGASSVLVSDGKKTRIVADTNGPFAGFAGSLINFPFNLEDGVSLNDRGDVAFIAGLDDGGGGVFTGPDVVRDKVIATGDPLAGSSVSNILMTRQSLNNNGQIVFQATLADGRVVIVRAEPKKQMLN